MIDDSEMLYGDIPFCFCDPKEKKRKQGKSDAEEWGGESLVGIHIGT